MIRYKPYPKYKDSGVEWAPSVPHSWSVVSGKNLFIGRKEINIGMKSENRLALTLRGVVPRALDDLEGLQSSDYSTYQIFKEHDLVFKLIDLQNIKTSRVGIVSEEGIMSPVYIRLEAIKEKVQPRFAYWFYTKLYNECIFNVLGGGVRQSITKEELLALPFALPSLDEQVSISSFLDHETARIDTLVEKKESQIRLLQEKRQSMISHAVTKGLNPNARMKDSGIEWLGQVPEHWDTKRIAAVYRETARAGQAGLPVLSISIHSGISDDELSADERDRKVLLIEDREKYKRVKPNDLAYNMMRAWQGAFGAVAVDGLVSPAYVVAEPMIKVLSAYVELLLRTPMAIEEMRRFSRGIADFRMRLYWEHFRELYLALPPLNEQMQIVAAIRYENTRIDNLIQKTERSIALLRERRSSLITAAVTGQIDVREMA